MRIECRIPITVRLTGAPTDAALEQLTRVLARTVASRVAAAERLLAEQATGPVQRNYQLPGQVTVAGGGSPDDRRRVSSALLGAVGTLFAGQGGTPAGTLTVAAGSGGRQFWDGLRATVLDGTGPVQEAAAQTLVELRAHAEALDIIRAVLRDRSPARLLARMTLVSGLAAVAGDDDRLWALILLALGEPLHLSAEGALANLLATRGGYLTGFLARQVRGGDAELRGKAGEAILGLLDLRGTAGSTLPADRFAGLRDLVAHGTGELDDLARRHLALGRLATLDDLTVRLLRELERGPARDPYEDADTASLYLLRTALAAAPALVRAASLDRVEWFDTRLALAIEAGVAFRALIRDLHAQIRLARQFFDGPGDEETDEVTALFNVRHGLVATFAALLGTADFAAARERAEGRLAALDDEVADVKQPKIHARFIAAQEAFVQAEDEVRPIRPKDDPFFGRLRGLLIDARAVLRDALTPGVLAKVFLPGLPKGRRLAGVVELETRVSLFTLLGAVYGLYVAAVRAEHAIEKMDVGDDDFKRTRIAALRKIRAEIQDAVDQGRLEALATGASSMADRLNAVLTDIADEARTDALRHLLITAIATIASLGVAAIANLALATETLAVLRGIRGIRGAIFLLQSATFTAGTLYSDAVLFGRSSTPGGAAQRFFTDAAMLGLFEAVGALLGPLVRGRALLAYVVPHVANLGIMTGVSALTTRVKTGSWPPKIGEFLLDSLAGYVIMAGIGAAAHAGIRRVAEPVIGAVLQQLNGELALQFARCQRAAVTGTFTRADFEAMREGRLKLNARGQELVAHLQRAKLITNEEAAALGERFAVEERLARAAVYDVPAGPRAAGRDARAILAPSGVAGLVRTGTQTYRYDPDRPPAELERLLARSLQAGLKVRRFAGGVIEVSDADNKVLLLLQPGPQPAGLLPERVPENRHPLLRKVTGPVPDSQLEAIAGRLRAVARSAISTLQDEFPEPTATAALGVLVAELPRLTTRWGKDAVRGLGKMLEPHRGISVQLVRRLFDALPPADLELLFDRFHGIAGMPGASKLVDVEWAPETSAALVEAYTRIRPKLDLPPGMTMAAVRGLRRRIADGTDYLAELAPIRVRDRLALLERDPHARVPDRPVPPVRVELALRRHAEDIRPGLNLLVGTPAEVVRSIEQYAARQHGALAGERVRTGLLRIVERYREQITRLQAGDVRDTRNLEGGRGEIDAVLVRLELGQTVDVVGNVARYLVDLNWYPLPGGRAVLNAPGQTPVQLDAGSHGPGWELTLVETTTGELRLPPSLAHLDPDHPRPGDVDWAALDPDDRTWGASNRKFRQVIRLYQLARYLRDLDASFRGGAAGNPQPAELVLRAGGVDAPARRVLERVFGVRVVTQ